MHIVLALGVSLTAGFADFLGGFGSRRAPSMVVSAFAHASGLVFSVLLAWVIGGDPTTSDWLWGAAAGFGSALGLAAVYHGYAYCRVSIVAPVFGVVATACPVLYAVARGDEMGGRTGIGIVLGVGAILFVSLVRGTGRGDVGRSLLFALIGGAGLGFLLIALGHASEDGGVWIVAPSRLTGLIVLVSLARWRRLSFKVDRTVGLIAVGVAILSSSANAMYATATTLGDLATIAVLASMFPAITVLLARAVFKEAIRPIQVLGFALAIASVVLIAGA